MKKLIYILILSILATSSYARGLAMSSGILDYSDDQKRSGFVEATYSFKIQTMKIFGIFTLLLVL